MSPAVMLKMEVVKILKHCVYCFLERYLFRNAVFYCFCKAVVICLNGICVKLSVYFFYCVCSRFSRPICNCSSAPEWPCCYWSHNSRVSPHQYPLFHTLILVLPPSVIHIFFHLPSSPWCQCFLSFCLSSFHVSVYSIHFIMVAICFSQSFHLSPT